MATDKPRFSVSFTNDSFDKIRKYQIQEKISTQSKAVASLVELALDEMERNGEIKKAPPYSEEAMKLAEDYDGCMDDRGRETVRGVADLEVARFKAEAAAALRKSREQMEAGALMDVEKVIRFSIPGYSMPMSAGTGQEAGLEYPEDYTLVKQPPRGTSYIAPVSGNSMEPTYHDGALLFIHACEGIREGQIGIFLMDGQQWVKELGAGVLISHNPGYDPIPMRDDIRCQGLVLDVCDESYFE